ncbi:hypothetical protein F7Q99_27875 [Streptomyces kaniharaensis]|uniref:Uncharacterized protein n=1 Tax=Streptomyces kaniharaensis TaxID=212423 RepID=A0A6N7L081_9ACTN|nr:hypothetical protein [Streptomyces kaniharaensis]MQS15968.1 hypothetical protein [Streptomyces kaniharaensis]
MLDPDGTGLAEWESDGTVVTDAADNLPLLSTNPDDALILLRLALERDLGSIPPGWVLPRPVG